MRRILVESARRKGRFKRGGHVQLVNLESVDLASAASPDEMLLIEEAIEKLAAEDAQAASLVKLRYFAGVSVQEAAELIGLPRSTAYEHWAYARAWLHREIYGRPDPSRP